MSAILSLSPLHPAPHAAPAVRPRLRVGVLVDLALTPHAGGHVKCWERLAEAAVGCPDLLDLTVHFNGPASRIELAPNVRYVLLPPVFSTEWLVRNVPDHTDLAPWHRRLAGALADYDVVHTTDAFFCYAQTATRFARRHGLPVVTSIHTNTPEYARITVEQQLERLLRRGIAYRLAVDGLGLPNWPRRFLERRLRRHLERVTQAIGGHGEPLRRGLDHALFSPAHRNRDWFEARFGLPRDRVMLMYAGKLNAGKNALLLIPVMESLIAAGSPVHLFCAGAGEERANLETRLGAAATCAGVLAQDELARAYASADIFLFPSVIDEFGNAGLEALASGLPAVLAAGSGVAAQMADCPAVWVLPGSAPELWVPVVARLVAEPERRRRLGRAARAYVEEHVPTWREVLTEDLLPVWQAAAAARPA